MVSSPSQTFFDLDWDQLWRNARSRKTWGSSDAESWDKKAASFATRNQSSPFVPLALSRLPLDATSTVLDVGCGSGTLALPIAKRVRSVTAIDFSAGMLSALEKLAAEENIDNIRTIQCSWEDNWQEFGVEKHTIAIASRSLNVPNLKTALEKLDHYATAYVYIIDRISPAPFDPEAFAAIGRHFESGPDYIYVINTLYSMGIHPNVDVISLGREACFVDLDDAMHSYAWMIKNMSATEEAALRCYLERKCRPGKSGGVVVERGFTPQWACIWWYKAEV